MGSRAAMLALDAADVDRLYNAGERIYEVMHYTVPGSTDVNCIAHWQLDAPEKDFFTVPRTLLLGESRIYVRFTDTLLHPDRHGRRVVLVSERWMAPADTEEAESIPIACTDKEAILKAGRRLEVYEKNTIQSFIDQCNNIRAKGGIPLGATGYTARLLRKYNVLDPAKAVLTAMHSEGAGGPTNAELLTRLERLERENEELKGKKPAAKAAR